MTPSLILTSSSSTDAPNCTKRNVVLPPFDVTTTHPTGSRTGPSASSLTFTTPTPITESACDAYDASINATQTRTPNRTLVACGWTGTPIRAIIPLPRRTKLGTNGVQDTIPSPSPIRNGGLECSVPPRGTVVGPPPYLTRSIRFLDDADIDSEVDDEEEDEGSDEDCDVTASRCLSYESITAAEGLSAWSFEELRVECYAQSLIARGTKPPPAVQPALAIPPAFVPRFVPRSQTGFHSPQLVS